MKKLTLTLLFSFSLLFCLAQTTFTEQTLLDMNKRMMQDYPKFAIEEVSPEYTFTTADGAIYTYQAMKDFKSKILEWNTTDLKIKQVGTAAIVRGINNHTIQSATNGTIGRYNVHFIYTYEYKNGKWQWFSSHHIYNNPSKADEEAVIKKLIEEERSVYHAGKAAELQKMWKDDAKTFHMGESWLFDNETLKKLIPTIKPSGATAALSNYRIKINGNMAVVDFDQITTTANGGKSTAHDVVILEKTNGQWLFTGSSIHNTLTKDDDPIEVYKQWVAEYNKDTKAFLVDKCPDDLRGTVNGGDFYGNAGFKDRKSGQTANLEPFDLKSFQSGNLAVIMGKIKNIRKQADGTEKPVKEVFTTVMQKRNGKWMYVGHHATDMKE